MSTQDIKTSGIRAKLVGMQVAGGPQEALTQGRQTLRQDQEVRDNKKRWKSSPDRGKSLCKGPGVGGNVASSSVSSQAPP